MNESRIATLARRAMEMLVALLRRHSTPIASHASVKICRISAEVLVSGSAGTGGTKCRQRD
jgi:hypothetical protein